MLRHWTVERAFSMHCRPFQRPICGQVSPNGLTRGLNGQEVAVILSSMLSAFSGWRIGKKINFSLLTGFCELIGQNECSWISSVPLRKFFWPLWRPAGFDENSIQLKEVKTEFLYHVCCRLVAKSDKSWLLRVLRRLLDDIKVFEHLKSGPDLSMSPWEDAFEVLVILFFHFHSLATSKNFRVFF